MQMLFKEMMLGKLLPLLPSYSAAIDGSSDAATGTEYYIGYAYAPGPGY